LRDDLILARVPDQKRLIHSNRLQHTVGMWLRCTSPVTKSTIAAGRPLARLDSEGSLMMAANSEINVSSPWVFEATRMQMDLGCLTWATQIPTAAVIVQIQPTWLGKEDR
jgi:hypothetical protein